MTDNLYIRIQKPVKYYSYIITNEPNSDIYIYIYIKIDVTLYKLSNNCMYPK